MHFCGHAYDIIPSGVLSAIIGWEQTDNLFGIRYNTRNYNDIPRGALIFFSRELHIDGHVGIAVGNGEMIHAWTTGVIKSSISDYANYYLGWRWPEAWTDDSSNISQDAYLPYRRVASVAWYPPNRSCAHAEGWRYFDSNGNGMTLGDNLICSAKEAEMIEELGWDSNWWEIIYGTNDLDQTGICSQ